MPRPRVPEIMPRPRVPGIMPRPRVPGIMPRPRVPGIMPRPRVPGIMPRPRVPGIMPRPRVPGIMRCGVQGVQGTGCGVVQGAAWCGGPLVGPGCGGAGCGVQIEGKREDSQEVSGFCPPFNFVSVRAVHVMATSACFRIGGKFKHSSSAPYSAPPPNPCMDPYCYYRHRNGPRTPHTGSVLPLLPPQRPPHPPHGIRGA